MNPQLWETSPTETCPRCNKPTVILSDGEYSLAEACRYCKWVVDFTADEINAVRFSNLNNFKPSMTGWSEEDE